MMTDADKPFIAYRQGRWGLKIVPRTAAGWLRFALWILALLPAAAVFTWAMASEPDGPRLIAVLAAFIAVTAIWAVAMTRWMYARSEVVLIDDLLAWKRERDAEKRRRR